MALGGVVVVGGAGMDLDVQASHFPRKGETVLGEGFTTRPGGKGATQASAIGRLGGKVRLVAKIGNDAFGHEVRRAVQICGVDTGLMIVDPARETGVTFRTIDANGDAAAIVTPGANQWLHPDEVRDALVEESPTVLLVQTEVPVEAAATAIAAVSNHCLVVLNLSPVREVEDEVLARVDFLVLNATETELLTKIRPSGDAECLAAATVLLGQGARNVIITLGEEGAFLATPQSGRHFSTLQHRLDDHARLGDVFAGALARFLSEGRAIEHCIYLANAAAALTDERPPTLRQMKEYVPELF